MPYPPPSFHFQVQIGDQPPDADQRFQEVTGLSAEVTTEEVQEGGLNTYAHKLPTGAKYGRLVLKRGLLVDSEAAAWCRRAVEAFIFEPTVVRVVLLNENSEPLSAWTFDGAYPVKWSVSDLKAQDNALAIETLELAYRAFRSDES